MDRKYLVLGFFWSSYFETMGAKRTWVSKQSYLTGFISAFSGIIFLFFLYLTVGATVSLSYSAFNSKVNALFLIFVIMYVFLLTCAVFLFFKDIFSAVSVEYDGKKFTLRMPITLKKYINLFFLREKKEVCLELASIAYTKVFFDFFSEGANYYYNIFFVFRDGSEIKFPHIYTTADLLGRFLDDMPVASKLRFSNFTKDEVEKIAEFFSVPLVYRE